MRWIAESVTTRCRVPESTSVTRTSAEFAIINDGLWPPLMGAVCGFNSMSIFQVKDEGDLFVAAMLLSGTVLMTAPMRWLSSFGDLIADNGNYLDEVERGVIGNKVAAYVAGAFMGFALFSTYGEKQTGPASYSLKKSYSDVALPLESEFKEPDYYYSPYQDFEIQ